MKTLTVTIPIPPKELSPNARTHHMVKARAVKNYRLTCGLLACVEGRPAKPWKRARVQAAFYVKTARGLRSDGDNRLASLKAAFDALRDAGIIADDSGLTHEPITLAHDKARPRVELTITELADPKETSGASR